MSNSESNSEKFHRPSEWRTRRSQYDYVFDLCHGETIRINDVTKLHFCGNLDEYGNTTKFAIDAPQDVCIMRLELFSKKIQMYDQTLTIEFGEKISIGENIAFAMLPAGKSVVKVGFHAIADIEVRKSFFNQS